MQRHSWRDPHMLSAFWSLCAALYATLGMFVGLFVVLHVGNALYLSALGDRSSGQFESGLAHELSYLKEQGDEVAQSQPLKDALAARDSVGLLALTKQEIASRSIGLMGVVDEMGVVVSRTKSVGKLGDNLFLTTPHGRAVAQGRSVESVEISGAGPDQLLLVTGRPIVSDGAVVGAVFASHLADDAYASRFKARYLGDTEIIFYTKEQGVYGNSFGEPGVRQLVNSYFTAGSEWIRDGVSDKTVSLGQGKYYLVKNVIFPGLEEGLGGALLFIPRQDISPWASSAVVGAILAIFIIFALRLHVSSQGHERGWRYWVLLALASVPVALLAFAAASLHQSRFPELRGVPYPLYNSTLRLQPDSGIYDAGFEQAVSVVVDAGDEAINAVQVGLRFDPEAVEIQSVDTEGSACSYLVEQVLDQEKGELRMSCVLMEEQAAQRQAPLFNILLQPKAEGTFELAFDPEYSKVLADDGLGTDVLRSTQNGSYRVHAFSVGSTLATTTRSFVLYSPTHPNESRWYPARAARFVWQGPGDAVYAYALDTSPETTPPTLSSVRGNSLEVPLPGDGIFYFHMRLVQGGPTAHYRILSDRTAPTITAMRLSSDRVVQGDVVRFSFEATDASSGVGRNYYVDLGNRLFLPVGSQLFIPFLKAGEQVVKLRAYDKAGNYAEQSKTIWVERN